MIKLWTTYYHEKNIARRAELNLCLLANKDQFDCVGVVSEKALIPEWFTPKCGFWSVKESRPTVQDILDYISKGHGSEDDVNVVTNGDILFTEDSVALMREIKPNQAYCLARYEMTTMQLWDVDYAQDTWVFVGKPRITGLDFPLGVMGGDNITCHKFHEAGYEVLNPSRDIRIYHVHASNVKTKFTRNEKYRLPRPYMRVTPTKIGEKPEYRA